MIRTELRGPRKLALVASIAAAGLLALSACSSGQEVTAGEQSGPKDGPLTIAFLQKQGDQQYFVDEADGAKAAAEELGDVSIKVVDLGTDANKAISELDSVIAQSVDGIIIVVPDPQIGPQVIDAAKAAGIPIMAADDVIEDASGAEAPFTGFDGTAMGNRSVKRLPALQRGRLERRRHEGALGLEAGPLGLRGPRRRRGGGVRRQHHGRGPRDHRDRHRQLRHRRAGQGGRRHHRERRREELGGRGAATTRTRPASSPRCRTPAWLRPTSPASASAPTSPARTGRPDRSRATRPRSSSRASRSARPPSPRWSTCSRRHGPAAEDDRQHRDRRRRQLGSQRRRLHLMTFRVGAVGRSHAGSGRPPGRPILPEM